MRGLEETPKKYSYSSSLALSQVKLTKLVIAQVKGSCKAEEETLTERLAAELSSSDEDLPPYDQARALGKTTMDVDRIA